ncbi:MAG: ATP-binding cassette domain-containing protein [Eubacterium sp.]|nr:ATP-binding cassette domain-containing protein [Eubacterium sp.]
MITVRNLYKEYQITKKGKGLSGTLKALFRNEKQIINAVNGLDFHVAPGEIVGFIGPNGSGKSTTIKMMTGILTPTSGEVLIDGRNIAKYRKEVVRDIGVIFGQRTQLNWDLRLEESFELLRHIYQINKKDYRETLALMDSILGIGALLNKPVRQMSLGQRVKGDLTAAMLHSPKVLFLDEPTIGLDVGSKYALRKFIKEINALKGTTVILTTHDLGDIQELCERLIIINNGTMVEDGNLSDIVDRIAPYRTLVVEYYDDTVPKHPKARILSASDNIVRYKFMKSDMTAAELINDLSALHPIKDIGIEEAGIDDIIRIAYNSSSQPL